MNSFKNIKSISSWTVFIIALVVYYLTAERTGSLWDCGEFILGAYKLEVVHPPGAPLFLLIGRLFTWVAEIFSSDPADIAFAVNLMSGIATAFCAFFVARTTMLFGKRMFSTEERAEDTAGINLGIGLAGLVAGLATAFCSSIWFSAVEGEVYALSTMFTAMTFWAATKWYTKPDDSVSDRWLIFVAYLAGLSIGVHLLSLLTFPAIALMYYFKKSEKASFIGAVFSLAIGAAMIGLIQKFIIVGIPSMWKTFEFTFVNSLGMPFHSGLLPTMLVVAIFFFSIIKMTTSNVKKNLYTILSGVSLLILILTAFSGASMILFALLTIGGTYYMSKGKGARFNYAIQLVALAALFVTIGFSTIGVVVIRANADTPINMNVPSDAFRLLPYINREQYGERALLHGPHFDAKPKDLNREKRYGRVGDRYEVVEEKLEYVYSASDKILFPRIGHTDPGRPALHRQWYKSIFGKTFSGKPGMGYNLAYMLNYQVGWMYVRYFMWNFAGKQNGEQGYYPWDKRKGHWKSGIGFIDEMKLYNMDQITDTMRADPSTNKYYMLPFIFGLIGLFFMAKNRPKDFAVLFIMFLITGVGIIIYSNQPPNEPRERDYVLVGSFFTYCMWIGLSVLAIMKMLSSKVSMSKTGLAGVGGLLALSAPLIMGFQNWDDHDRSDHFGSRDYAANFLNSLEENSIIFTYGDNDTYPLWYAQEVENIRTDVRVVNLSLIAVDWYINKLRNKVNDSAPLKFSLSEEAYRGKKRNQIIFMGEGQAVDLRQELNFIADDNNMRRGQSGGMLNVSRTKNYYIPINKQQALQSGWVEQEDADLMVSKIPISFGKNDDYFTKDELAVMDILANNLQDRPIYFAVTCKNEKLLGLNDYMQLEGLGLRVMPIKSNSLKELVIYGSGRVDTDATYNNIMDKWAWGNFDKVDTHISSSYGAELQAMKIVMMRTANALLNEGKKEKALNLAKKFFEAFPHFNFPYDDSIVPFTDVMIAAGDLEEAKIHLRILADETYQNINFYESLDEEDFDAGFTQDYGFAIRAVNDILRAAKSMRDPAFEQEMTDLLGQYDMSRISNK